MICSPISTLARIAILLASLVVVGSCGSGAVGTIVTDPLVIRILPDTATLYSGLPTTFTVTGGTGAYIVTSSNQAVVPIAGPTPGTFTIIPNPVTADTVVTLTARDTGTTPSATATLTVKPGTVSNTITVTPGSTACSPGVCSGGDAAIAATISQGGIPLAARGVRFDVVSGDFRFITSPAGTPETTALSVTTITDEVGIARARLRVNSTAPNQVAIMQVTDLGSGAFQRLTFFVAQASSTQAGFFTIPTSITYTGPDKNNCASGLSTDVFIFGGTPSYTISNTAPGAFDISNTVVGGSGGRFTISPKGQCVDNAVIGITDAAGRTISINVSNKVGTTDPAPTPIAVAPETVTLNSCSAIATVVVAGGTGTYSAGSSSGLITAAASGNLVSIQRAAGSTGAATSPQSVQVTVTDGVSVRVVTVTLTGNGATDTCP